ncbi:hypothetical protein GC163_18795 [bacterium]|nr:hypothetical protein [bacterium]
MAAVLAQQPPGPAQRPQRPAAADLRVAELDPKLESILERWEVESAKIQFLQGTHYRQELNKVFAQEKRSQGAFFFQAPDRGRFDMTGTKPEPGQDSSVKNPETGEPYELVAGNSECWICNGQTILQINHAEKQYEQIPIPPEMQGKNIVQSPLPFLFGMKADEAKRRFELRLKSETADAYIIDAKPLQEIDARNYQYARIYLDKQNMIPTRVMLIDPAGTINTNYAFRDVEVNPNRNAFVGWVGNLFGKGNPFQPNLTGYKQIQAPGGVIQPAGNQVPADRGLQRNTSQLPTNAGPSAGSARLSNDRTVK